MKKYLSLLLALALCLGLVACGGNNSTNNGSGNSGSAGGEVKG